MKKIIFGKDKKPPKPPTAKGKSKSKSKSKAAVVLPTLFSVEEPMLLSIQPFNIEDEREYLKEILKLEDYNDVRIQLTHFGNLFPNIGLKKGKTDKDPLIEEKYKGPKYKKTIDLILSKYTDVRIIKYFLRLFLNQYALTLEDFYNKFLINPDKFNELRELRKLFLKILKQHDNLTPDKLDTLDEEPELVNLDISLIKTQLEEFSILYPEYKDKIEKLLENFDLSLMIKFMTEFLNQSHQSLEEFYKEFITDPKIKLKINKIKIGHETIEEKPVKISKKLQGFVYEQPLPEEFKKCIALYMSVPWLSEKIEKIYIAKADSDIDDLKLKFANSFMYEGKEWFRVNKKYYELQCSKFNKIQKDNVINFMDKKTGNLVKNFILGYGIIEAGKTVKKGEVSKIIIQNQDIFNKEQEYIKQYNKTDEQKILEILEEPIKPDSEKLAIDALTQNMQITRKINKQYVSPKGKVINTIEDETTKIADVQFIKDIVDKISDKSKNLNEFIHKLGELIIPRIFSLLSGGKYSSVNISGIFSFCVRFNNFSGV